MKVDFSCIVGLYNRSTYKFSRFQLPVWTKKLRQQGRGACKPHAVSKIDDNSNISEPLMAIEFFSYSNVALCIY